MAVSALAAAGCRSATSQPPPSTPAEDVEGFRHLNELRRAAGLSPVEFDQEQAEGAALHARYLELNKRPAFVDPYSPHYQFFDHSPHDEVAHWPGYTEEGAEAGRTACLGYRGTTAETIDEMVATYRHRLPLMSPGLASVGIATRRVGDQVFHVIATKGDGERHAPFVYPADGQRDVGLLFESENPEPRPVEWFAGAPRGAAPPSGFPVTIDFDRAHVYGVSGQLETADGTPIEAFSTSLTFGFHTSAVILPRRPLEPDTAYVARFDYTEEVWNGVDDVPVKRSSSTRFRTRSRDQR